MQSSRRIRLACLMVPALVSLAVCEPGNEAQAQATNGPATNSTHPQSSGQARKPAAPPTAPQTKPATPATSNTDALEKALQQKMGELNGKTPVAPAAPAAAAVTQSAPAATPKPTVATPAPAPPPPAVAPAVAATATTTTAVVAASGQDKISPPPDVVLPAGASASDIDKARAALHQKMSDMNAQDATTGAATGAATATTTTPAPERVVVVTGNAVGTVVTDPARDASVKAAVQEANTANQGRPAPAVTAPTPSATKSSTQLAPLNGPPLSISWSKEERLRTLLSQYQADQISPEQYHEQRAKILAEP